MNITNVCKLTFKQHGFELQESTYMWIFSFDQTQNENTVLLRCKPTYIEG